MNEMKPTKKKKYQKMTQEAFDQVKGLSAMGASIKQIEMITGRGNGTINMIRRSKDFADYQQKVREQIDRSNLKLRKGIYAPKPGELVDEKQPVPIQPMTLQPKITEQQQTYQMLERIALGIERLAEAWERKPQEKVESEIQPRQGFKLFGGNKE